MPPETVCLCTLKCVFLHRKPSTQINNAKVPSATRGKVWHLFFAFSPDPDKRRGKGHRRGRVPARTLVYRRPYRTHKTKALVHIVGPHQTRAELCCPTQRQERRTVLQNLQRPYGYYAISDAPLAHLTHVPTRLRPVGGREHKNVGYVCVPLAPRCNGAIACAVCILLLPFVFFFCFLCFSCSCFRFISRPNKIEPCCPPSAVPCPYESNGRHGVHDRLPDSGAQLKGCRNEPTKPPGTERAKCVGVSAGSL